MNKIIAFTGKKRHGKSTACEYIQEKYPNAVRVNFKDAMVREMRDKLPDTMREICALMEKIDYDGMNPWTPDRLFKDKPPVFRALMQNYGTEVRRHDHDEYWVLKWMKEALKHEIVVTDDVRFGNECEAVRELGGTVIRIVREGYADDGDGHSSEKEMDAIVPDYTIVVRDGDLEDMHRQLDAVLSKVVV